MLNEICLRAKLAMYGGEVSCTIFRYIQTTDTCLTMRSHKFAPSISSPMGGKSRVGMNVASLQVLPMVISRSPRKHVLKATFQDSGKPGFQDGVIEALQSIAKVVPDGMLVFLPSYGMLNKLYSRWGENGML